MSLIIHHSSLHHISLPTYHCLITPYHIPTHHSSTSHTSLITAPLLITTHHSSTSHTSTSHHFSQVHFSSQLITTHHSSTHHHKPSQLHFSHLTYHITTSHHNSSQLITSQLITAPLLTPLLTPHFSHHNSSQLHFSHLTSHTLTHHSSTSHTSLLTPHLSHHNPSQLHFSHHLSHTLFDTPSFTHHLSHTHTTLSPTIFDTPSFTHHLCHTQSFTHTTLSHTIFHTPSFTHSFVTHHLSHTIFHTHHLSHATLSHTIFPPPPPLSFLPSPPPLQHFWLIIGRSWLVGISGPFIASFETRTRTVIRGQMPGIRGRRQHMGWFDPDNDRSRELRFLIFSLQLSAGCAVAWFLWNAHHIAQNKDRIHGFSKAPILLWHTVGSFFLHSLMTKSRSCPRMKLSRFIFMLGTLHKNLNEEHDSKHACKSFFPRLQTRAWVDTRERDIYIWSRPPSRPGAYIQLQIYGQYQHDESYTKRSKSFKGVTSFSN